MVRGSMASKYEKYDPATGVFTAWPELQIFGLDELMAGVVTIDETQTNMCDVGIYDISPTMLRSLRQIGQRYPGSYARIFHDSPGVISELVTAELAVELLVDTSLHPLYSEPELSDEFYHAILDTGVAGLIVKDELSQPVVEAFPGAVVLRRVADLTAVVQ